MDKKVIVDAFNNTFAEFLVDLTSVFPENKYIKKSKTNLRIINNLTPKIVIGVWNTYINDKYYDTIMKGELQYFLEKDYAEDLQVLGADKSSEVLDFINNIREPIKNLDSQNLDTSLSYLQNLSKLSYAYNNM